MTKVINWLMAKDIPSGEGWDFLVMVFRTAITVIILINLVGFIIKD